MKQAHTPQAWVVLDLGFGDAGKGATVDRLVSDLRAPLVVRFQGGPQAAHNVVPRPGVHHTFAQFGSGTFTPGCRTHLGREVMVHPGGWAVERHRLARLGVSDAAERWSADPGCTVLTPIHTAAGRLRERRRGEGLHGSCGIGFGEAVADALHHPDDRVCLRDLSDPPRVAARLERQRLRLARELQAHLTPDDADAASLLDPTLAARAARAWAQLAPELRLLPDEEALRGVGGAPIVLEGAQGALLDEAWGFHPHTTWSDCTFHAADRQLASMGFVGRRVRLGVARTYATRHGAGPFPTEDEAWSSALHEAHNGIGEFSGAMRCGPLDLVLLRYAVAVAGRPDALSLTHDDAPLPRRAVVDGYAAPPGPWRRDTDGRVVDLLPGEAADLAHREALGRALRQVTPLARAADDVGAALAEALGAPIALRADGPARGDRRWTTPPERVADLGSLFPRP